MSGTCQISVCDTKVYLHYLNNFDFIKPKNSAVCIENVEAQYNHYR